MMGLEFKFGKKQKRDFRRRGGRTNGLDVPVGPMEFWSKYGRESELERRKLEKGILAIELMTLCQ